MTEIALAVLILLGGIAFLLLTIGQDLLPERLRRRKPDPWSVPFGAHGEGPRRYERPAAGPAYTPSEVRKALAEPTGAPRA